MSMNKLVEPGSIKHKKRSEELADRKYFSSTDPYLFVVYV
jgi:hypothetical protein